MKQVIDTGYFTLRPENEEYIEHDSKGNVVSALNTNI